MIENYFFKTNGAAQSAEAKREKAVSAVLEIIKEGATNAPMHVTLSAITDKVDQAADAVQAALEK